MPLRRIEAGRTGLSPVVGWSCSHCQQLAVLGFTRSPQGSFNMLPGLKGFRDVYHLLCAIRSASTSPSAAQNLTSTAPCLASESQSEQLPPPSDMAWLCGLHCPQLLSWATKRKGALSGSCMLVKRRLQASRATWSPREGFDSPGFVLLWEAEYRSKGGAVVHCLLLPLRTLDTSLLCRTAGSKKPGSWRQGRGLEAPLVPELCKRSKALRMSCKWQTRMSERDAVCGLCGCHGLFQSLPDTAATCFEAGLNVSHDVSLTSWSWNGVWRDERLQMQEVWLLPKPARPQPLKLSRVLCCFWAVTSGFDSTWRPLVYKFRGWSTCSHCVRIARTTSSEDCIMVVSSAGGSLCRVFLCDAALMRGSAGLPALDVTPMSDPLVGPRPRCLRLANLHAPFVHPGGDFLGRPLQLGFKASLWRPLFHPGKALHREDVLRRPEGSGRMSMSYVSALATDVSKAFCLDQQLCGSIAPSTCPSPSSRAAIRGLQRCLQVQQGVQLLETSGPGSSWSWTHFA